MSSIAQDTRIDDVICDRASSYIPASVIQKWFDNFQRRFTVNPYFWKNWRDITDLMACVHMLLVCLLQIPSFKKIKKFPKPILYVCCKMEFTVLYSVDYLEAFFVNWNLNNLEMAKPSVSVVEFYSGIGGMHFALESKCLLWTYLRESPYLKICI